MTQTPDKHVSNNETLMINEGVSRFNKNIEEAILKERYADTKIGNDLVTMMIEPFTLKWKEELKERFMKGGRGRRLLAMEACKELEPEVIGLFVAKVLVNSIHSTKTELTQNAIKVGSLIEDELRIRSYMKQEPKYISKVLKDVIRRTPNYDHQRSVLIHSANKKDLAWESWPSTKKVKVGMKCLEFMIDQTGLFVIKLQRKAKTKSVNHVLATETFEDWIKGRTEHLSGLEPLFQPMTEPPLDWVDPWTGAYHNDLFGKVSLVKSNNRNYLMDLYAINMPEVYKAVNAVQSTPWKINKKILEVMIKAKEENINLSCLTPLDDLEIPEFPHDLDGLPKESFSEKDKERVVAWKRKAGRVYEENIRLKSKRLQFYSLLGMAHKYADKTIWFPNQLDFRSRMYALTSNLSPQGSDESKGLLQFAEGKTLGERGAFWLRVHGANTFGYDKVSLNRREEWVFENAELILKCAMRPLDNLWWTEADKPWQFLAFCFEYADVVAGFSQNYVSHLPIQVDGSCNGLQNFSALLKDEKGGLAVNLIQDSDTPNDIYTEVLEVINSRIDEDARDGVTEALNLKGKVNRSLVKRPVMTSPYGATRQGFRDQTQAEFKKQKDKGVKFVFIGDGFEEANYLAGLLWDSIGFVLKGAQEAMSWLRETSLELSKEALPIHWVNPVGFPVLQDYRVPKVKDTVVYCKKQTIRLRTNDVGTKIDSKRQANGISPNFVHSMDAAHMMKTINSCKDLNITNFCMIHDSYGTHASDMDTLNRVLREEFVKIYEKDWLSEFKKQVTSQVVDHEKVKLNTPPSLGSLDVSKVLESEFFFS